jgi:hypothetical protein
LGRQARLRRPPLGGWGLAQVTELFRDRRLSDRERHARRAELQRATLLELQDALLELSTRLVIRGSRPS